jgi:hypothetical protein
LNPLLLQLGFRASQFQFDAVRSSLCIRDLLPEVGE